MNDLHAEQQHLGELPTSVVLDWSAEEARDSEARLTADDELHRKTYPADLAARKIRERLAVSQRSSVRKLSLQVGPLLAAAVLIIGIGVGPLIDQTSSERTKGAVSRLAVYRQSADGVTQLVDGARARAGDRLQVEFVAPPRSWVFVFSVDGAGVLTSHFPETGTKARQIATGDTLVPQTYVLDAAPLFERFYLVVADHQFDRDEAWLSLRDHPLETRLPSGLTAYPLTLKKDLP